MPGLPTNARDGANKLLKTDRLWAGGLVLSVGRFREAGMKRTALAGALLLLASLAAASELRSPAEVAGAFYATYLAGGKPSGVPDERKLKQLEPFASKRLLTLLRDALAYRERWITEHPPEPNPQGVSISMKPPFGDGVLFSSLFEGPTGFAVGRVAEGEGAYRVDLNLYYDERGQSTFRWRDVVIVVREADRFVVDDMELLGDWPFGYHGRVSEILKERE